MCYLIFSIFFFNDTATTEIYTLSLHDALPIWYGIHFSRSCARDALRSAARHARHPSVRAAALAVGDGRDADRKSTRLNSSHLVISYAVFCLKKKKMITENKRHPRLQYIVSSTG